MIIDVHTHIAPDRIAPQVEAVMRKQGMHVLGSLTVSGLLAALDRAGIDKAVVFCVAERPSVVKAANDFLIRTCAAEKRLIGLGTIHPDFDDYKAEIQRLRQAGIKGVKWHSLIQGLTIDEERMLRFYPEMGDDMIALFHVGGPKATPQMVARVMEAYPQMRVVAAHFGGEGMLEEARRHLWGKKNLYLDTACSPSLASLGSRSIVEAIWAHGADKVLFASDYPTADPAAELATIRSLPLTDAEKERILGRNAQGLFGA